MEIPKHIKEKLSRLYSYQYLGTEEILALEKWLKEAELDPQMDQWLLGNWKQAKDIELEISFEEIRKRIEEYGKRSKPERLKRVASKLQKIAAVLVLPLIVVTAWLLITRYPTDAKLTLVTAKGERTHVWLPDSSQVWLNVDSRLEYSTAYNVGNRLLKLEGEAFFKVAKGKKSPFVVKASDFEVKAVGTEFNISAYSGEAEASTYLKEGIVELSYSPAGKRPQKLRMSPGQEATVDINDRSLNLSRGGRSDVARWMKGELFFDDNSMDEVFRKVERWYNIKIDYRAGDFEGERFTVNLANGEPVGRLFQIIDNAMGITVKKTGDEYIIRRK